MLSDAISILAVAAAVLNVGVLARSPLRIEKRSISDDRPSSRPVSRLPEECVSIKETTACAPWNDGYYINITAIKENYGLDIAPTVQAWSDIVVSLGYGGELLKDTMKSVAGCDGPDYDGDTIQFMRTNLCLYDIFTASSACNVEVPKHKICKETCDSYKAAVDDLLSDPKSCPVKKDLPDWGDIEKEREYVSSQSTICASQIAKWEAKTPNYDDVCFVGVKDDMKSCGLGGNIEEAETYCKEFPKAVCCDAYKKAKADGYKGVDPKYSKSSTPIPSTTSPSKASATGVAKTAHIYPECLPIDDTSACAPWAKGYFINSTALGLQYGLTPLTDPSDWDQAVTLLTSGGDLLKQVLGDYTGCTGYAGEPIQFLKTYVCLIDIFDFSEKCNRAAGKIPPAQPLCEDTCHAYGASMSSLIGDDDACPDLSAKLDNATWSYIQRTRQDVADGGKYCANGVKAWQSKASTCVEAVEADSYSCGFAGNAEVAQKYCDDLAAKKRFPTCCDDLSKLNTTTRFATSNRASLLNAASDSQQRDIESTKQEAQSWIERNKTAVIVGSVIAAALILVAVAACCCRRRKSSSRNHRVAQAGYAVNGSPLMSKSGKEVLPLTGGSQKSFGTANSTRGGAVRTKVVGHQYVPQLSDELELRPDDVIEVMAEYDDGWGKGMNTRTKNVGTFPMACLR